MTTMRLPHPPAFEPFHAAHRVAVLRLLVGMVGPVDAEDCYQESWLKALRAWPPADPSGRLDSWILTIAHRTALDHLRRRGREQPVARLPEVATEDDLSRLAPGDLHHAVAHLPEQRRAALLLRVVLDRSHAQVAQVLGCSEPAARRACADALAQLRTTIGALR
jgi:RNA polymerase sigma factor (sigma-70 family)